LVGKPLGLLILFGFTLDINTNWNFILKIPKLVLSENFTASSMFGNKQTPSPQKGYLFLLVFTLYSYLYSLPSSSFKFPQIILTILSIHFHSQAN